MNVRLVELIKSSLSNIMDNKSKNIDKAVRITILIGL